MNMYYIYGLWNNTSKKIYIGQTSRLSRRLEEHNKPNNKYTGKFRGRWKLIYSEEVSTRSEAIKRERQLKSYKGREYIKQFIPG